MSKIITPKFMCSYPTLFKPRAVQGSDVEKFSIAMVFSADPEAPPGSATLEEFKKACLDVAYAEFGDTDETRKKIKSGKIKMPFKKLDEDSPYGEDYAWIVNANTDKDYPPGVVDRFKGPDGKPKVITDAADIYAGCFARASVKIYAYDKGVNKGVTCGLNNVQKLGEGERIDGRSNAGSEFDALDESGEIGSNDLDSMIED